MKYYIGNIITYSTSNRQLKNSAEIININSPYITIQDEYMVVSNIYEDDIVGILCESCGDEYTDRCNCDRNEFIY